MNDYFCDWHWLQNSIWLSSKYMEDISPQYHCSSLTDSYLLKPNTLLNVSFQQTFNSRSLVSLNCNAPMQYVKYGKQYDLIMT